MYSCKLIFATSWFICHRRTLFSLTKFPYVIYRTEEWFEISTVGFGMSHSSSSERKKRENNTFTVVTTTVHNNKIALASVKIYLYVYFKRFTSLLCYLIYYRAYTGGSPTGHNHRTTCLVYISLRCWFSTVLRILIHFHFFHQSLRYFKLKI